MEKTTNIFYGLARFKTDEIIRLIDAKIKAVELEYLLNAVLTYTKDAYEWNQSVEKHNKAKIRRFFNVSTYGRKVIDVTFKPVVWDASNPEKVRSDLREELEKRRNLYFEFEHDTELWFPIIPTMYIQDAMNTDNKEAIQTLRKIKQLCETTPDEYVYLSGDNIDLIK